MRRQTFSGADLRLPDRAGRKRRRSATRSKTVSRAPRVSRGDEETPVRARLAAMAARLDAGGLGVGAAALARDASRRPRGWRKSPEGSPEPSKGVRRRRPTPKAKANKAKRRPKAKKTAARGKNAKPEPYDVLAMPRSARGVPRARAAASLPREPRAEVELRSRAANGPGASRNAAFGPSLETAVLGPRSESFCRRERYRDGGSRRFPTCPRRTSASSNRRKPWSASRRFGSSRSAARRRARNDERPGALRRSVITRGRVSPARARGAAHVPQQGVLDVWLNQSPVSPDLQIAGWTATPRSPGSRPGAACAASCRRSSPPAQRDFFRTRTVSTLVSGSTSGRNESVCGQMGTNSTPETPGWTIEEARGGEYAVERRGRLIITPSAKTLVSAMGQLAFTRGHQTALGAPARRSPPRGRRPQLLLDAVRVRDVRGEPTPGGEEARRPRTTSPTARGIDSSSNAVRNPRPSMALEIAVGSRRNRFETHRMVPSPPRHTMKSMIFSSAGSSSAPGLAHVEVSPLPRGLHPGRTFLSRSMSANGWRRKSSCFCR